MNHDKSEATITTQGLYGADVLKYYLRTPSIEGSVRVAELQANWKDKVWFAVFSIFGSVAIVLIGWLLGFIKIIPFWEMWTNP